MLVCIDGSLSKSKEKEDEEFSECHAWAIVNSTLCLWLLNIIEPKLQMSFAYSKTAKIMWADLKKQNGTTNTPIIHQLR